MERAARALSSAKWPRIAGQADVSREDIHSCAPETGPSVSAGRRVGRLTDSRGQVAERAIIRPVLATTRQTLTLARRVVQRFNHFVSAGEAGRDILWKWALDGGFVPVQSDSPTLCTSDSSNFASGCCGPAWSATRSRSWSSSFTNSGNQRAQ